MRPPFFLVPPASGRVNPFGDASSIWTLKTGTASLCHGEVCSPNGRQRLDRTNRNHIWSSQIEKCV